MPQELDLEKWKQIHPDFTIELIQQWIKYFGKGRSGSDKEKEEVAYQKTQKWIEADLTPSESKLTKWLVNKNYIPNWKGEEWNREIAFDLSQKEQLQKEYLTDWGDLHPNFAEKDWRDRNKTYQQHWQEQGFTKEQVRQWIASGFKKNEYQFATYLRDNGYTPENWQVKSKAQHWLDWQYPAEGICIRESEGRELNNYGKTRQEITEIDIRNQKLTNELDLSDFTSLEELNCPYNQLTKLTLPTPNQLKIIWTNDNPFSTFDFTNLNPNTLTHLDLSNNNLEEANLSVFSSLVNLKELIVSNENEEKINDGVYNRFEGSLEFLQNLTKLITLEFDNTDIDDGVEYLPSSVRNLNYSTELRPNCRLTKISSELEEFMQDYQAFIKKKKKEKLLQLFELIQTKDISSETTRKALNILIFNLEQVIINDRRKFQAQIEIPPK